MKLGGLYDYRKLVGTVGDTLVHIVCKNERERESLCLNSNHMHHAIFKARFISSFSIDLPNRQKILNILMSLGSFGKDSLKVRNASNRTALEELEPPYSLRIPLAGYTFAWNVRLRETQLSISAKLSKARHDELKEEECIKLRQWNQRSILWNRPSLSKIPPPIPALVEYAEKINGNDNLTTTSYSTKSSLSSNHPPFSLIYKDKFERQRQGRVINGSEHESGFKVPFVDSGLHRGYLIAHRWVFPKPQRRKGISTFPLFKRQLVKAPTGLSKEEKTVRQLQFCVQWSHFPNSMLPQEIGDGEKPNNHGKGVSTKASFADVAIEARASASVSLGTQCHERLSQVQIKAGERSQRRYFMEQIRKENLKSRLPLRRKW